ncbi:hypothetical protein ACWJJH_22185 [Endozoicomonadaceae bacterium StTr2]
MSRTLKAVVCLLLLVLWTESLQAGPKRKAASWWRTFSSGAAGSCTVSSEDKKVSGSFLTRFVENFGPSGFESPDMNLCDEQRGAPDFQPVVRVLQSLQQKTVKLIQSPPWGSNGFSAPGKINPQQGQQLGRSESPFVAPVAAFSFMDLFSGGVPDGMEWAMGNPYAERSLSLSDETQAGSAAPVVGDRPGLAVKTHPQFEYVVERAAPEPSDAYPIQGLYYSYDEHGVPDGVMAVDCGFPGGCRITNALILQEKDKGICTSCLKQLGMEHATDGLQVGARFKPVGKSKEVWDGVMFNPDKKRGPVRFYQTRITKVPDGLQFVTYLGYVPVSNYKWYTCSDEHVLYRSLHDEEVFSSYPKW